MHSLDHHDGVVDHDGDCKHQGRQGDEVDGEPDELHREECTHKGYRDGDGRDDG